MKNTIKALEQKLELEKNIPNTGYEKTKELILELTQYKKDYEKKIQELNKSKDEYAIAKRSFFEMKSRYQKEMKYLLKTIQLGTK